jgi:aminoglycoside phosphotransferase (APT) family kinase protein
VHRDLGPAHVLHRNGELAGVIDWTDACVGDPAIDLAWLLHEGPRPLAAALEEALDVTPDVRERSRLHYQLRPWYDVAYGLEHDRDELVSTGLRNILDRFRTGPGPD